jgi:hypothetical protein
MVVNRDGQGFFCVFLTDAIKVKVPLDGRRFGDGKLRLLLFGGDREFPVENVFAEDDAVVANVNVRSGDELAHFGVRLAAETAHGAVVRTGHGEFTICDLRFANSQARGGLL